MRQSVVTPWQYDLANRLGTPIYIYDIASLKNAHRDLIASVPLGSRVLYSMKANPHPRLASVLASLGCGAEVSSAGELEYAVAAGFAPADCFYTGPGKTSTEIILAMESGVRQFSAESAVDIDRLAAAAHTCGPSVMSLLLRVNPDGTPVGAGLAMTGRSSQFGVDVSAVLADPAAYKGTASSPVVGVHLFQGSNLGGVHELLAAFSVAASTASRLREAGCRMDIVNLGGGFGAPFARVGERVKLDSLRDTLESVLDEHLSGWRAGVPRVVFESGRYLVAECGSLVTRVLDVKQSKGRTYVVVDAGVHHLGGMSGLRRIAPMIPALVTAVELPEAELGEPVDVVGPLCTPLDCWARDVRMAPVVPGDLLAVPNVGAYGLTASLIAFLSRPTPVEAVVDGERLISSGRIELVRVEEVARE